MGVKDFFKEIERDHKESEKVKEKYKNLEKTPKEKERATKGIIKETFPWSIFILAFFILTFFNPGEIVSSFSLSNEIGWLTLALQSLKIFLPTIGFIIGIYLAKKK